MFNIKKTAVNSYHIYEGDRNDAMLYRYSILKQDTDEECDGIEIKTDNCVRFDAVKRALEIDCEHTDYGYKLRIPLSKKERLFGLGDATRKNVMIRGIRAVINIENVTSYGPMPVVISSDGWGFVLNSTFRSVLDCAATDKDTLIVECTDKRADFYLFRADTLKGLVSAVTSVTGRPVMLPKFAYGLTLVQNEETDARSLLWEIKSLRERGIPCDVVGLEPSWMEKYYDYSTEKKWNKKLFPFPIWEPENTASSATFLYAMREMGMQLSLWLCTEYDLFFKEDNNLQKQLSTEFTDDAVIKDEHFDHDIRMDPYTKPDEAWFEH